MRRRWQHVGIRLASRTSWATSTSKQFAGVRLSDAPSQRNPALAEHEAYPTDHRSAPERVEVLDSNGEGGVVIVEDAPAVNALL
jgi:hypothetical protein